MPNRLTNETSPHLRQHAKNPVDWYPWGEEAFRRAREEDKPIHLSVGYAACHWCHVMAHESFENPDVARLTNERFVNIKGDCQERPDVDDIYRAGSALLPLVETVHRSYQPSRVLAFADDVPVGQGRVPIEGKPAAYVCRNRTCDAQVTTVEALRERCVT